MSVTAQMNSIFRGRQPIPSLLKTDVLVEKLDRSVPTIHDAIMRLLQPQMFAQDWSVLLNSVPSRRVSGNAAIWCMSTKGKNTFNAMALKVRTPTERTIGLDILYTDKPGFTLRDCPRVTTEEVYAQYENGEKDIIDPEYTYVIRTTTKTTIGSVSEMATDYLFYIPEGSLVVQ